MIKRLLLVDDESEILVMYRLFFSQNNFQVDTAEDGKSGLERAQEAAQQKTPYDVIVSDIELPIMDGLQFYKAWSASGINGTAFLFYSGVQEDSPARLEVETLKVPFVGKPAELTQLLETIDHLVEEVHKTNQNI